jgi:hypothetical protein
MIDIPWYALISAVIIATGVSYLVYYKDFQLGKLWKTAAILRFFGLFLLVLLFFAPTITLKTNKIVKSKLLIYRDVSASCDSMSLKINQKLDSILNRKFGNKINIASFEFAKDIVSKGNNIPNEMKQITRFDQFIKHFKQQAKDESVTAALVISDGIMNQGQMPNFIGNSAKVPLFAIGLGDSVQYPDLMITGCLANDQVYKENTFVVEGSFEAKKIPIANVEIQLKEGNRIVQTKNWLPGNANDFTKLIFDVKPSKIGWVKYSLQIKGKIEEKNALNNTRDFWVQVVEEKKKIHLVYGKPHPDIKSLKLALESKIQNEISIYSGLNGMKSGADIYIFHGFPTNKNELISVLNTIQKRIPIWVFVDNPMSATLLSEQLNQNIGANFNQWQEVATTWNENYGPFLLEGTGNQWKSLGAVNTPITRLSLNGDFQTQLFQKWNGIQTNYPLFGSCEKEGIRSLWFFGNGIWKWRMNEGRVNNESKFFDEWVSKNILWLGASGKKQKEIQISLPNRTFLLGSEQNIAITHFDQTGLPQNKDEIEVYLIDSNGIKIQLPVNKNLNKYQCILNPKSVANYRIRASLKSNAAIFDEQIISVSHSGLEQNNTTSNFDLLRQISHGFGGSFYVENSLNGIIDELSKNLIGTERIVEQEKSLSFMQISGVMLILVFIFAGEWFLRKWLGKI